MNRVIYADGEPDYFDIMSGDTYIGECNYESDDALPFVIANDQLYIGGSGYGHESCDYPDDVRESGNYAFGRLWFCVNQYPQSDYDDDDEYEGDEEEYEEKPPFPYSILTFWYEDEEHTIDVKLVDELLAKYGIDKNLVLVASFEEDDYGTLYPYTEWNFKIAKSNERQKEVRAMHLMNAYNKHNATSDFRTIRDRKIGKKLTNDKGVEMPVAQYRSMIYGENKKRQDRIIKEVINKYLRERYLKHNLILN